MTYKEVFEKDPQYIEWFLHNNYTIDIDRESFLNMMRIIQESHRIPIFVSYLQYCSVD